MKFSINEVGDAVCEHGTALDVHCCPCRRSGFFPPVECDCYKPSVKPRTTRAPRYRVMEIEDEGYGVVDVDTEEVRSVYNAKATAQSECDRLNAQSKGSAHVR